MTEKTIEQIDAEMMSVESKMEMAVDKAFDLAMAEAKAQEAKNAEIYQKTTALNKEVNKLKSDNSVVKNTSIFAATLVQQYIQERKFNDAVEIVDLMKQYRTLILSAKAVKDAELKAYRGW